nr:LysM peptidoglycan-binding domain-containing protein [Staphylococcus xylosus]
MVSGTESNSNQSTYTVQYGDSLELIANKFNTTISELQSLNNISNPDFIQVGQTNYLSGTKEQSNQSTYTIQYGDTLESIAYRFGTTINDLQSLNGITNPDFIQVGQVINIKGEPITSSSKVSKYTVQSGDNLSLVAQKFNTTVSELQSLNHLANPDFLQMGQKLLVPGSYNENEKNIEENDNSNNNSEDSSIPQSNDKYLASKQQLVAIGWPEYVVTESMLNDLNSCLKTFEITTKSRVMHFISQCSHESVAGTYREEIASGVDYEWRADLGNTQPGDGTKFKGGGYIQLTGRSNYTQFANSIGDSNITSQGVSYVAEKYPWTSAGFWWYSHGMNLLCDSNPTVEQVTLRVNGGYNGLADRKQYYLRCLDVFSNFGQKTHANSGSASWLNQYGVTAEYGYYAVNVNNNMHYGMDFGLFTGTPVKAITNGTVLETNWNPGGGGNTITIKEDDNHYQWYMHLSEFNVTPGQNVNTGDVIAYSGATGGVTGPHLHFQRMIGEVSNSAAENPREFLENLGLNKK